MVPSLLLQYVEGCNQAKHQKTPFRLPAGRPFYITLHGRVGRERRPIDSDEAALLRGRLEAAQQVQIVDVARVRPAAAVDRVAGAVVGEQPVVAALAEQ